MDSDLVQRIISSPEYIQLRAKRSRFGWTLTLAMLAVYYGFIALVAFGKSFMAQRLGAGVTTLCMPLGVGVIVFTIAITGIYVRRANGEFDDLIATIRKNVLK